MNRKQLLILLVLVVVVGLVGLMRYRHGQESWQGGGISVSRKLLGELPVNDVTTIVIKGGTNELDLVKKDDRWRVKQRNDYPANYGEISGFLLKAADLKAIQVEEVDASQLPRYKLLPAGAGTNTAVSVDLLDKNGKSVGFLLLGKTHMRKGQARPSPMGEPGENEGYPDGRYVMTATNSKSVAVISDPFSDFGAKPEAWVSKDFFKVEKIKSIAVIYPNATNSWKLSRDSDTATEWKLNEAKPDEHLDAAKTSAFSYALSSPAFNDVLPSDSPQATASVAMPTQISIDTFDNFEYNLKVGQKTNDTYPVVVSVTANLPKERVAGKDEKPEDKAKLDKEFADKQKSVREKLEQEQGLGKWTYFVTSWTLDPLLKERKDLLSEKKEDKPADSSTSAPVAIPTIPDK